jgi:hypothetical protein
VFFNVHGFRSAVLLQPPRWMACPELRLEENRNRFSRHSKEMNRWGQ